MKSSSWILVCLVLLLLSFGGGAYFGKKHKPCPECKVTIRVDTVLIPGDTIFVDNPKPVKTYPANLRQKLFVSGQKSDSLISTLWMADPCDSLRTYKFEDSTISVIDSVHGILLGQTIVHKPTKQITKTVTIRKDSLIYQSGLYFGGSAGLNSIRLEAEYLKKGWSFSGGYDLINKSPVLGIRRKIF